MTFSYDVKMWEILVPTINRLTNKPYRVRYHRVWDEKVRELCGGLTIMPVIKGQWKSTEGKMYFDRMIPVRIAATEEQIRKIIDYTLEYYKELAVLCYMISDQVIVKHSNTE